MTTTLNEKQSSNPNPATEISHIKAITHDGFSQNITIDKLKETTAIDYTSLEEQIVHGERYYLWSRELGNVYTRTLQGVSANSGHTTLISLGGSFAVLLQVTGLMPHLWIARIITIEDIVFNSNPMGTVVLMLDANKFPEGQPFIITLTYSRR